jgi:hypothetical protein
VTSSAGCGFVTPKKPRFSGFVNALNTATVGRSLFGGTREVTSYSVVS